jgi:hypothetical protein
MTRTAPSRFHRVLDWVTLLGAWALTAAPGLFLLVIGAAGLADPARVQAVDPSAVTSPPEWWSLLLAGVGVALLVWPAGVVLSRLWPPRGSMADAGPCDRPREGEAA